MTGKWERRVFVAGLAGSFLGLALGRTRDEALFFCVLIAACAFITDWIIFLQTRRREQNHGKEKTLMTKNPNRFQQMSVQSDGRGSVTLFALTADGRLFMMQGHPKNAGTDPNKTWLRVADAPDEGGADA